MKTVYHMGTDYAFAESKATWSDWALGIIALASLAAFSYLAILYFFA